MSFEESEGLDFTCENCGSNFLTVFHRYEQRTSLLSYVLCDCEEGEFIEDGLCAAASRPVEIRSYYLRTGNLNEEHAVEWERADKEDLDEKELDSLEVHCRDCFEAAEAEDWKETDAEVETVEGSDIFEVQCAGCGREIEFGWSSPEGGTIWPIESADFNPMECWPPLGYLEVWAERGWLNPRLRRAWEQWICEHQGKVTP